MFQVCSLVGFTEIRENSWRPQTGEQTSAVFVVESGFTFFAPWPWIWRDIFLLVSNSWTFCIWSSPGFIQDGFIYVFQDVFICFLLAMLGLCCCTWAFSSCGKWGSFSSGSASFSLWWLLLLQSTGFRHVDFDSCDTWASLLRDRWGLPDPGVNLHPLHWQVDS